jgi:hypothetical protein
MRPIRAAAFRLIVSFHVSGCSTGSSAGTAPLRMVIGALFGYASDSLPKRQPTRASA